MTAPQSMLKNYSLFPFAWLIALWSFAQEPLPSDAPLTPPPLLSDRTEDQVEAFLALAPPGTESKPVADMRVYYQSQFDSGNVLATVVALGAFICLSIPGMYLFALPDHRISSERVGQDLLLVAFLALLFSLLLYSLAFSRNAFSYGVAKKEVLLINRDAASGTIYYGDLKHMGLQGLDSNWSGGVLRHPLQSPGSRIPHQLHLAFELLLYLLAVVALLAAGPRCCRSYSAIPFWILWSLGVYVPLTYWTQGGGWFADCIDAQSSLPIYVGIGFTALGIHWSQSSSRSDPGSKHSNSHTSIGAGLLFAGILIVGSVRSLFNAPWLTADSLNFLLAGSAGTVAWSACQRRDRRWREIPLGFVAGVIAISAGSASVTPSMAILIGFLGTTICYIAFHSNEHHSGALWRLFTIVGIGGFVGLILAGVFTTVDVAGSDRAGVPIRGLVNGTVDRLRTQCTVAILGAFLATVVGYGAALLSIWLGKSIQFLANFRIAERTSIDG